MLTCFLKLQKWYVHPPWLWHPWGVYRLGVLKRSAKNIWKEFNQNPIQHWVPHPTWSWCVGVALQTTIAIRFKGVFNEHIGCIVPFSFYSIVVESSSILSMPDTNTPTYIYIIDVFAVYMHGSNDFSTMSPHAKCWGHWVHGQHSFIDGSMEAVTHMSPGKSCFIHADACIWPYHVGINHACVSHCYMGAIMF